MKLERKFESETKSSRKMKKKWKVNLKNIQKRNIMESETFKKSFKFNLQTFIAQLTIKLKYKTIQKALKKLLSRKAFSAFIKTL